MQPTTLVFSSHDRCYRLHHEWIVQRALRGNRRILFLPLSMATDDEKNESHQRYNWDCFNSFFEKYEAEGLDACPFIWHRQLRREDVDLLWHALSQSEVVILGGGRPQLGMQRYQDLGRQFFDDADRFRRTLFDRQARGLLTAGYSAGIDQLCQLMSTASGFGVATAGFGLARDIIATPHFAPGHEPWVAELARAFPHCLVFGLPNDSALAVSEGCTARGARWQLIQMIVDTTWDKAEDAGHIKTRQGIKIRHRYADGRDWGFNDSDRILRIEADGAAQIFLLPAGSAARDYWRQEPCRFESVEAVIAAS